MEKPKRGTRPISSKLTRLLVVVIFFMGMAVGMVIITAYNEPTSVEQIALAETSMSQPENCMPLQRTYEDIFIENEATQSANYVLTSTANAQGVQMTATALAYAFNTTATPSPIGGGMPGHGSTLAPMLTNSPTGTPMPTHNPTGTPMPMTGGNGSTGGGGASGGTPATSVAFMNIVGTPAPSSSQNNPNAPVMNIPGTYTPMPMGTGMSIGTPMPQNANTQAQVVTDLQTRLSAGEIDDNNEWGVYLTYRKNFAELPYNTLPVDDVDVRDRQLIRVVNADGEPILGATVEILADDEVIQLSCTYATGYTMFLPHANGTFKDIDAFSVRASKDGITSKSDVELSDEEWTITLDVDQKQANLDLLFLIDATGSMDDEIAQLTNNILYISEKIHALPDDINVRYGLVSYKDWTYTTEVWDFTHDVDQFQSQLAQLYTAGGDGETLNDGLDRALHAVQWRGDDTVKLVFLVGDEPPGVYEDHPSYAISMMDAARNGIKIHPIASSGLDVQGEYIFRQIAQTTMGHFIFLTYGDGQTAIAGTGDVSGSVSDEESAEYSVEQLHEIVLNLIRAELRHSRELATDE